MQPQILPAIQQEHVRTTKSSESEMLRSLFPRKWYEWRKIERSCFKFRAQTYDGPQSKSFQRLRVLDSGNKKKQPRMLVQKGYILKTRQTVIFAVFVTQFLNTVSFLRNVFSVILISSLIAHFFTIHWSFSSFVTWHFFPSFAKL